MQEPERYLYRAPVVLPVCSPPIRDGAVLTEQGRVKAVGRFRELADADAELVDYQGHVLMPPLVNGHAHLELSSLGGMRDLLPWRGTFPEWITRLIEEREKKGGVDLDAGRFALANLYAGGCGAVIDIGNTPESRAIGEGFKTRVQFHLEVLGLSVAAQEERIGELAGYDHTLALTPHAVYSTGKELLSVLKRRCVRLNQLFTLHVAESKEEVDLLMSGGGPMAEFLKDRGAWDGSFSPPGCFPVSFLDSLRLLDQQTLCVHVVHLAEHEPRLLAERKASVCLCPASNRYLGVGVAPLEKLLACGLLPAIGTDSLASNRSLSLWEEMRILRQDHPGVLPETVLAMATEAGARIMGIEQELGVIRPGVSSSLLAVVCEEEEPQAAMEYLTTAGLDVRLEWIE